MKKLILIIGILLLAISCNKEIEFKPQAINFDRDACHVCKMGLTDQRFNVQAMNEFGEVYFYDDIGCLAEQMRDTENWNKWKGNKIKFWIGDATKLNDPSNWIDAETAFYDYGKHTPMGYGYSANEVKPEGDVYSFQEVLQRINEGKTMRETYIQKKMLMMKDNPKKIEKLKKKLELEKSKK